MLDFTQQFENLKDRIVESIKKLFPREGKIHTIRLKRIWIEDKLDQNDYTAQKESKIRDRTWAVPVYGDFDLIDNATGKVIDHEAKYRLASVPKMTSRGSFIVNGNEYQVSSMLRLKPGVYTVIQANGVLDSWVNLAHGKNFNVMLDPKTGLFSAKIGTSNVKLYPLLIGLGINKPDIEAAWGTELTEQNSRKGDYDTEIIKAHTAFLGKSVGDVAEALANLTTYFSKTVISPETTEKTLGKSFSKVDANLLLETSKKILGVSRGRQKTDDRDALEFKTVHSIEDLIPERIEKTSYNTARAIDRNLDRREAIRYIVGTNVFSTPVETFFIGSDEFGGLAQVTPQTNPLSMIGETTKATTLGPGGIPSLHSITLEARAVNPTSFGFLDPIHTPENERVGTSLHFAGAQKVGHDLVISVIDPNTMKTIQIGPAEMAKSIVAFRDQYDLKGTKLVPKTGKLRGILNGTFVEVPKNEVKYVFPSAKMFFDVSTNIIPFLHSDQGNRAMYASKMFEQALPLLHREIPLVQANLSQGITFAKLVGHGFSKQAPVDGTVTKVTADEIRVKDKEGKTHVESIYNNFPLNTHVYLQSEPKVQSGDKVKKGQLLADTNYTKDGTLAVGTNLLTAYVPYKGYNFEDGIAISESASKKLTSLHMHQEMIDIDPNTVLNLKKFKAYYPNVLDVEATNRLDDEGVVKIGQKIKFGDIVIAALRQEEMGPESEMLRKLHRAFVQPYRNAAIEWDSEDSGTVIDVVKQPKKVTVYITTEEPAKIGDKLCYSEDTEILTWSGWKGVSEITTEDALASLGPCGQLEYLYPESINCYEHDGRMYSLETTQASLLITENHKLYAKPRRGTYGLHRADELFGTRYRLKNNVDILRTGNDPGFKKLPDYIAPAGQGGVGIKTYIGGQISSKCYAFLLGAFLSEGCVIWQPEHSNYGIAISQTKSDGVRKLLEAFEEHGLEYTKHVKDYIIYNKSLAMLFSEISPPNKGRQCYFKRIPNEVWSWTPELQLELFNWLIWGDGCEGKTQLIYTTTSKGLADDIQRLALHLGFAANIRCTPPKLGVIKGLECQFAARYDVFFYLNKNHPEINHGHCKTQKGQSERWISYVGKVYCPTLPKNHILYVRRNGKAVWSGNSGSHGNKGVITRIIPDSEVPRTKDDKLIEILLNPNGIIGRINLGQVLETAASKVAEKDGKPYIVENFSGENYVDKIRKELKARGLTDKEDLHDPMLNKTIPGVLVGKQYILKLDHPTRKKFSARSTGGYTVDLQPHGGGGSGGQSIGKMEFAALLSHGAVQNLREMATIKSERQDEFWRFLHTGHPLPAPQIPFSFQKLEAMIKGMGVDVVKEGHKLQLAPMTDKQIKEMSNGEIKDALAVRAKDLRPERDGIFDPVVTGGLQGKHWNHVKLAEPVPNPVFEMAIRELLSLTEKDYRDIVDGHQWVDKHTGEPGEAGKRGSITGGEAIKYLLSLIKVDREVQTLKARAPGLRGTDLEKVNRKLRYLTALKDKGFTPDVYVIENFPIVPAIFRPIYPMPNGNLGISQINELYRDTIMVNNQLKEADLPEKLKTNLRRDLYDGLKGIVGLGTSLSGRQRKGFIEQIAGDTPKTGYFQSKILGRRQEFTGRSTVIPEPGLGLDEIALPELMAWKLYEPFIIREMVQNGQTPLQAQEHLAQRDDFAKKALEIVMKDRPVLMNRAPTLHKFGIMALMPTLTSGQAIKTNPLVIQCYNMDFDGDTAAIHIPITEDARREAFKMLPSANLFSPRDGTLMNLPSQESVLGLYLMTQGAKETGIKVRSLQEANKLFLTHKHKLTDIISIGAHKTTLGQALINSVLPAEYRNNTLIASKKNLAILLNNLAKTKPQVFAGVVSKLKDLGNEYAYEAGFSVGLDDFVVDAKARDKIFADADKKFKKDGVQVYVDATRKMDDWLQKDLARKKNPLYQMVISGARGNMTQVRQIMAAPVLVRDMNDNPIPVPIRKSFSEGLPIADYLASMPGARKGIIDRALMTSKPGAFSKELISATLNERITMTDCGTMRGITVGVNESDVIDRYLAKGIGSIVHRNDLITPALLTKIRGKVKEILVRSPSTCEAPDGVCQMCYGLDEHGKIVGLGRNVGVLAAQTITEPMAQLTMRCLSADTIVATSQSGVQKNSTLAELFDELPKLSSDGKVETKIPDDMLIWDGAKWAKVSSIQRHLLEYPMMFLSVPGGAQICQVNHPVVVHSDGKANIVEAQQADGKMITSAKGFWGRHDTVPEIPGYLVGMYLAEGCVRIGNGTERYAGVPVAICWSAYDKNTKTKISEHLKAIDWKHSVHSKEVAVYSPAKAKLVKDMCPGFANNKRLAVCIADVDTGWLITVLAGLIDGDGTIGGKKSDHLKFYTSSFILAQQAQIICNLFQLNNKLYTNLPRIDKRDYRKSHVYQSYILEIRVPKGHLLMDCSIKASKLKIGKRHRNKIVDGMPVGKINKKLVLYPHNWVYDIKTETGLFCAGCMQTHNTFHTGSVAGAGKGTIGGFQRIKEILEMHETVIGKATLAETAGKVEKIDRSPAGGWQVDINGEEHFIEPGRTPTVKVGDQVHKGDRLSDGTIKPQEMLQLKGIDATRIHLIDEVKKEFAAQGIKINSKIFETAIRPLVNAAQITDPGSSHHLHGDVTTLSAIYGFNKDKTEDDKIKFEPKLKGVNTYPLMSHDWLTRLNYQQLAKTLTQGAAQGWKADVMKTPVGAYAYGVHMGQEKIGSEKVAEEPEPIDGMELEDYDIPEIIEAMKEVNT